MPFIKFVQSIKKNKFILLISLLPSLYLLTVWQLYYDGVKLNDFLYVYFDNITDFSEYLIPLKYIKAWLYGDMPWLYAKLAVYNPIRLMNLFPSIPIGFLLIIGINAYFANLITATLSIFVTNFFLHKIYNEILSKHYFIKYILILFFTILTYNYFFRSYVNQACFVLNTIGIFCFIKYLVEYDSNYLKRLSLLLFISFFSYTFAMLYLLSLYFFIGFYLFINKRSLKRWLKYFLFPFSGIVIFLSINILYSKIDPDYYKITSYINRVESVLPSIDFKRFLLLLLFSFFSIIPLLLNLFLKNKYKVYYSLIILTIALLFAHFHTIIDRYALQENWHFTEIINISFFFIAIFLIKYIELFKNHLIACSLYLMIFASISFIVLSDITFKKMIGVNNFDEFKDKLSYASEIDKKKVQHFDNIIVDVSIASVWQSFTNSNPLFIEGSGYFFVVDFEKKIDFQVLSFCASKNIFDTSHFKLFVGNNNSTFSHNYLTCAYNYNRFGLCSVFKNSELCIFYKDYMSDISRDSLLKLFSNNDKIIDFFRKTNNPIINKYFNTYRLAIDTPMALINKYNIRYAVIHKEIYSWWKEKTNANICDSLKEHYIIKF